MKTTFILLIAVVLSNALCAAELEWVDEQIEAIKPPRKGVFISSANSPFIFLEKNKPKTDGKDKKGGAAVVKTKPLQTALKSGKACDTEDKKSDSGFTLSAIINSSAMINGEWYKKSDKINSYTITDISKDNVTLKKGDKQLVLSTNINKPNLKFKNK